MDGSKTIIAADWLAAIFCSIYVFWELLDVLNERNI